ncbi:VPLPA-CTERM sorting domain-containing protein [Poseidonocella sedimentorum]|uniref:VPLPA-CTERM protein sorting domain-containing protein n=1 Tax=Poseidonocella sedimentorum TaxID=871652 RepID=A0A1I6D6Z6_9RHOB|nr:VPLPA-CTERM sorting domain-containing protein [Poseidonocella sedimentorum]SFR01256.1 VPLPA-CTERM protein sorting domain-containing protein [Poseidonocella sedimentorum]
MKIMAAAIVCAVSGMAANAATIGNFTASGSYDYLESPSEASWDVSGAFTAWIDPSALTWLEPATVLTITATYAEERRTAYDEQIITTVQDVSDTIFEIAALASISDLIDYIDLNLGTDLASSFISFSGDVTNVVTSGSSISGDFDFLLVSAFTPTGVDNSRDFVPYALSVTFEADEPITPVPLPASAPLLAAGLGAIWLHRRRSRVLRD